MLELAANPSLLREQLLAKDAASLKEPIILDEVQKVPPVLDEVRDYLDNKYGGDTAERLTMLTPMAIVEGAEQLPLSESPMPAGSSGKKWYQFWR